MSARRVLAGAASTLGLVSFISSTAHAEYDSGLGGWTEVIECPTSSWDECPFYHDPFYWGGTGPNLSYTSPVNWWSYAAPGVPSMDCGQWINGGIVGGASYEPGQPSVPQGVDVQVSTHWWDFANTDFSETCGHQHATTYVWGWRYNGSSWSFEFVTAHQKTSYLGDDGICYFQAEGNPDYPGDFEMFAFGPETLSINNSPYAVLYTKTQATSHYSAGCGEFECFHRVRVAASYEGGPGVNKGVVAHEFPSNELTIERRGVEEFQRGPSTLRTAGPRRVGSTLRGVSPLQVGSQVTLNPTLLDVFRARGER